MATDTWIEHKAHVTPISDLSFGTFGAEPENDFDPTEYTWEATFAVDRGLLHEIMTDKPLVLVTVHRDGRRTRNIGTLGLAEQDAATSFAIVTMSGAGIYAA